MTVRRLDPPAPGAVAVRVTYRQSDGPHVEQAVPAGGRLVVPPWPPSRRRTAG